MERYSYFSAKTDYFEFDFSHPDCPTEESVKLSQHSKQPANLYSKDDYFYNQEGHTITNKSGKLRSLDKIFQELFHLHLAPTYRVRGLPYRLKIKGANLAVIVLYKIASFLEFILKKGFGQKLEGDLYSIFPQYKAGDLRPLPAAKTITVQSVTLTVNYFISLAIILLVAIVAGLYLSGWPFLDFLENYFQIFTLIFTLTAFLGFTLVPTFIVWLINCLNALCRWVGNSGRLKSFYGLFYY